MTIAAISLYLSMETGGLIKWLGDEAPITSLIIIHNTYICLLYTSDAADE